MHVSQKGIDLITEFEGFSAKAYKDPGSVDGLPITIGYGTTKIDGKPIKLGDTITKAKAMKLLREHLVSYEDDVLASLDGVELNQNEFDAVVSLVYNIGITSFKKSTVRRCLLKGDRMAAANAFGMWNKNDGKVLAGLVRRRAAEKVLFLTPVAPESPVEAEGEVPVAPAPSLLAQASEKSLLTSKTIIAGAGSAAGGVVTFVQSMNVDDLVAAKRDLTETRAEVKADNSLIFHNQIIQGMSFLFVLIGILIVYKRIRARMDGHK